MNLKFRSVELYPQAHQFHTPSTKPSLGGQRACTCARRGSPHSYTIRNGDRLSNELAPDTACRKIRGAYTDFKGLRQTDLNTARPNLGVAIAVLIDDPTQTTVLANSADFNATIGALSKNGDERAVQYAGDVIYDCW